MEARSSWQNIAQRVFPMEITLSTKQSKIESSHTLRQILPHKSSEKEG